MDMDRPIKTWEQVEDEELVHLTCPDCLSNYHLGMLDLESIEVAGWVTCECGGFIYVHDKLRPLKFA